MNRFTTMDQSYDTFIKELLEKHTTSERFPATSSISRWTTKVLLTLFPEQAKKRLNTAEDIEIRLDKLQSELLDLLEEMSDKLPSKKSDLAKSFMTSLPKVHHLLSTDVDAILKGDPAAKTSYEIIRSYPGFYATAFFRIAHELYELGIPMIPRIITEYAHSKTGIDIHPGATIDTHFCIDHGTGVVIGETCCIGKNVKLYQNITLGALSVSKEMAETKRHPTLEDEVVVYAGTTILGGDTIIGKGSVIGGNVWLTKSVPANSTIYHQGEIKVRLGDQTSSSIEKNISKF